MLNLLLVAKQQPELKEILDNKPGMAPADPVVAQILDLARHKASTEPKDKMFAFYGIFRELDIDIPEPDYTKPVEEVYREAAEASILFNKDLLFLYMVPLPSRMPPLLSWVPDWSDAGAWESDNPSAALYRHFRAAGTSGAEYHFSIDRQHLITFGKIVDKIELCAPPIPVAKVNFSLDSPLASKRATAVPHMLSQFHKIFRAFQLWSKLTEWFGHYPTGESVGRAFYRTLLQDTCTRGKSLNRSPLFEAFSEWYKIMVASDFELIAHLYDLDSGSKPASEEEDYARRNALLEQIPEEKWTHHVIYGAGDKQKKLVRQFHTGAFALVRGRVFFTTDAGLRGTSPDLIQEGDLVALLSGVELPMVLRRDGENYRLVTHAYVHGIMDGEKWPKDESELEQITLV